MSSNPHAIPYRVLPHGIDWMKQAACRDVSQLVFENSLPEAVELCGGCPVVDTCLDHLLSWPEQVGYGGGMTEQERTREAGAREWAERKRRQNAEQRQRSKRMMAAV